MRVYLDLCCLKRPFDDLSHPRVRLESEAVLAILDAGPDRVELLHAPVQDLENDLNPVASRAARVREWLEKGELTDLPPSSIKPRVGELTALGFKEFDAAHLASAEACSADALATCDDRFLRTAARHAGSLRLRVLNPIELAKELLS